MVWGMNGARVLSVSPLWGIRIHHLLVVDLGSRGMAASLPSIRRNLRLQRRGQDQTLVLRDPPAILLTPGVWLEKAAGEWEWLTL